MCALRHKKTAAAFFAGAVLITQLVEVASALPEQTRSGKVFQDQATPPGNVQLAQTAGKRPKSKDPGEPIQSIIVNTAPAANDVKLPPISPAEQSSPKYPPSQPLDKDDPASYFPSADPNDEKVFGLARSGKAYFLKGDYDRAISNLDEAIRLNPKYYYALASRGVAYRMKGDNDRAISDLDEAIRLNPKYGFALASRGVVYASKGDYDRAMADLDAAIRLDPKDGLALASRGYVYRVKRDYDHAISDFDAAIRADPKNQAAIFRRDEALKQKGASSSVAAAVTSSAPSTSMSAPGTAAAPSIGSGPTFPGRRVALVIGNASYRKMPVLANPVNDASDVGYELERLGFDVQIETNADRTRLNDAMSRFSGKVDGAEVALFYYAGHGMQFQGRNYLLPIDADLQSSADVNKFNLLPVDDVVDVLGSTGGLQLIVLDACRNNPVEQDFKAKVAAAAGASRDVGSDRGFTRIETKSGLLLAYATAPNHTAADGIGRNSPFTTAFLNNLKQPNLEVRQMLNRVQADVYRATQNRQLPEISSLYVGPDLVFRRGN